MRRRLYLHATIPQEFWHTVADCDPNRHLPSHSRVVFRLVLQMSLTVISEHAFRLLTVKLTVGDKAEFLVLQTVWSPWNRPYRLICQLFLQPKESRFCSSWRGVEARIVQEMANTTRSNSYTSGLRSWSIPLHRNL